MTEQIPRLKLISGGRSAAQRFEALVKPYYGTLFRVAWRWTRSTHDAEDLVQELYARAWPRLEELERLEQPYAWLMRVMYRLYVDMARRYDRNHVSSIEDQTVSLISSDPQPQEEAERAYGQERLERAWRLLDNDQCALLAMHDVEGYTLKELVSLTGLKEGTLKSRLHRARVRLGRLLQRHSVVPLVRAGGGG